MTFDFGALRLRSADNIKRTPGQHTCDGIEVGSVHLTPEAGGFEGDGTTTTKRIRNLWFVTKACNTKLFDKVG